MTVWVLIVGAALWGYWRGVKTPGVTRGRVVLLAGVAAAGMATLLLIFASGMFGLAVREVLLAYGYWGIGYAFVVGAVVGVVALVGKEWLGRGV